MLSVDNDLPVPAERDPLDEQEFKKMAGNRAVNKMPKTDVSRVGVVLTE